MVVFGQRWLYSGKKVVFCKSGFTRVKDVVKGQKLLYSVKVVVFGQKWFSSDKSAYIRVIMVVFGQNGCIWAKIVVFGQNGCIRAKWLYSCKVVVFG